MRVRACAPPQVSPVSDGATAIYSGALPEAAQSFEWDAAAQLWRGAIELPTVRRRSGL